MCECVDLGSSMLRFPGSFPPDFTLISPSCILLVISWYFDAERMAQPVNTTRFYR